MLNWFDRTRRDLPWRAQPTGGGGGGDGGGIGPVRRVNPYHVFVSEFMLQQTQVSTVIPYFHRFIERFPTFAALAAAEEQQVLRWWQGLGYYARARNLHQAAKLIMIEFAGVLPQDVKSLRALPGIGRYTAGAIASIAFEIRAPILDGNVKRILCRLDRIDTDPRDPATLELLWARAEQLLPTTRPGDFNSALMDLGALICTPNPRPPQCLLCPLQSHCSAFAAGVQELIPAPKLSTPSPLLRRYTFCIHREGQWLIEQRPATGRWAGMWQFVTLDGGESKPNFNALIARLPVKVSDLRHLGKLRHALTHRRYEFTIHRCENSPNHPAQKPSDRPRRWVTAEQLAHVPLPRPHVKIAAMLGISLIISGNQSTN